MKPERWWPLAVVAVLAITVLANVFILWAANDPDSAVVEPDYYRKGVMWDSTVAQAQRDHDLGWRLEAGLGPLGPAGAELTARLVDREGAPVPGAALRVTAVHNKDAGHPVTAMLEPDPGDGYRGRLAITRAGIWELRFEATRGAVRYTESLRREAFRSAP